MNKMKLYLKKVIVLLIIECFFFRSLTIIGLSSIATDIISTGVIVCNSLLFLFYIGKCCRRSDALLCIIGYIIRITIMFLDLYGRQYITILHSGADTESFYSISLMHYNGDFSFPTTNYSYLIDGIYHFFGLNRTVAQYINILFWIGTLIIIIKVLDEFNLSNNKRLLILFLFILWPNNICLSSILLRESAVILLNTLSFYLLIQWLKNNKARYAFLSIGVLLPSLILHSGAIGLFLAYIILISFWNPKRKKMCWTKKSGLLLFISISGLFFVFSVPYLKGLFFMYIPGLTMESLVNRWSYVVGGSDYLRNIQVNNYFEFVILTGIRMVYFLFSPIPVEWRGFKDALAFMIDSVPMMACIILGLYGWKKRHGLERVIIGSGMFALLCNTGVFAWGVSNAGTALRHRGKILGILLIILCVVMSDSKRTTQQKDRIYLI